MNSIITVNNGKIEVPLGKRHGIKISALAVTKGEQTPFNVLGLNKSQKLNPFWCHLIQR